MGGWGRCWKINLKHSFQINQINYSLQISVKNVFCIDLTCQNFYMSTKKCGLKQLGSNPPSHLSLFCLPIDIFSCLHTCVYTCPRTVPACLHVPKSDLQTRSTSEWINWNLSSWLESISDGHVVPASTEGLQMPRRWSRLLLGLKWSMSQTASGENHGYCLCFPWCESAFL